MTETQLNSGPLPDDDQQARLKAIAVELANMSREIYCRIIARDFATTGFTLPDDRMQEIARESHKASKAFYEGLGVIQFNNESTNQG